MFGGDISHFTQVGDYLPIITAALMTDMVFLANATSFSSKQLLRWYHLFGLSAVLADTLILVIGVILTRFFYYRVFKSFSLIKFCALAVVIQIVHDLVFALFFQMVPRNTNKMLDVFKDYANEKKFGILLADAAMVLSTCVIAALLVNFKLNTNIILLIVTIYVVPYFLHKY
jgi:hypothetical protein